jgi:transcriptional regulator with XRE-family HTH domain
VNRIREFRLARDRTMAEVAVRVGATVGTVWRWETGRRKPSQRNARALARALGVTVEELALDGAGADAAAGEELEPAPEE